MPRKMIVLFLLVAFGGSVFSQDGSEACGIDERGLLELVSGEGDWITEPVYRCENDGESFYQVRVFDYQGEPLFVFFGAVFETDDISIYIVDSDGSLVLKQEVPYERGAGYYFDNSRNIRMKDESIYYFVDRRFTGNTINLETGEVTYGVDFPFSKEAFQTQFDSPSGRRTVEVGSISLTVIDNTAGDRTVLFEQPYTGGWSIGQMSWANDDLFYFDNSGPVACIWEVDLEEMTLTKVVPEHVARHPFFFEREGKTCVAYVEGSSIKVAFRNR